MPKIELYQRRISIPGEAPAVPANIGVAGIVGESIAGLGRTGLAVTGEIVNVIVRRNEEMRKQNNAFAVLKAQNSIDTDTRAFKQSYDIEAKKGDLDPGGLMKFTTEKTDAFSKELDKKYLSNIDDPDQKVRIETYRNAAIEHVLDHTSVFQANARKDFANNEVSKAAEMSIQDAREGTDPGIARDSMRLKIGELHASGYYSVAQAEDMIVKSDQGITVAYFDGLVALDPEKAIEKLKDREYRQYLPEADYRRLMEKAKTLNEKKIQEEKEMTAYVEASEKWSDAKQAMVEVLKPEFMKKHDLTINQAQNIAQSFNAIGAQKERDDKDRQDANLDAIRKVAITDPARALKIMQTSIEDVDPKEMLALQRVTESHIRSMSLMGAQEKALRMDLEDKIKVAIKAKILAGGYKSEQELTNAVIAEGLSNTSSFLDDALGNFRTFKKDAGSVNYFQQAEEDWNRLISTSKSTKRKRELQDMKPKVLEGLRQKMEKDGLRVSDPKVFEAYQVQRKTMTDTWFTKTIDSIFSGSSGDSFVAPTPGKNLPPAPVLMDEATARKKLDERGVKGADQDKWIKRYREEGVIK